MIKTRDDEITGVLYKSKRPSNGGELLRGAREDTVSPSGAPPHSEVPRAKHSAFFTFGGGPFCRFSLFKMCLKTSTSIPHSPSATPNTLHQQKVRRTCPAKVAGMMGGVNDQSWPWHHIQIGDPLHGRLLEGPLLL